jgi:uncharacterized phage protein gp47/JayE
MTMADYGLLTTGYNGKPFAVIRDELGAAVRAKRGPSADISDGSLLGQMIAISAEREASLWDLGAAIVSAADPDAATDAAQDALCALTGTFRSAARASKATVTLCGTPNTLIATGTKIATVSTGALFQTQANATIATLATWAPTTGYVLGARVTNASRAYQCTAAGTSAGSGGPTTTAAGITDGSAHWTYLGEGIGAVDVTAQSLVLDAIVAAARDLTVIQTPVGGLQSARNLTDATVGAPQQTNESLRVTRDDELAQSGSGTADAIRAQLREIAGVTSCTVFHNDTDATDANGLPPHSVRAVVTGGDDTAIATVLFGNVPAGLTTDGTTTISITDSQGTPQLYKFTRPAAQNIYVDITLTYNPDSIARGGYTGDAAVKAAIAAFGASSQGVGKDAVASSIGAAVFPVNVNNVLVIGVQGVLDVVQVLIYTDVIGTAVAWAPTTAYVATVGARSVVTNDGGRTYICITAGTSAGSGGPTGTGTDITDGTAHWRYLGNTISISQFQQASLDTGRITVHSSAGTV